MKKIQRLASYMVWYNMIWYGIICYGIWYGHMVCDMVYGTYYGIWYMLWYDIIWYAYGDMDIRYDMIWYGII